MSLAALIILLLLAVVMRAMKWRRASRVVLALAVLLFVTEGCGLFPSRLLRGLQAPYAKRPTVTWASRNVVVLLGAGTVRTPDGSVEPTLFANGRINEALVMYRDCVASGNDCKLEVSGGDALHTGESEADVYGAFLEHLGVPAHDLLLESRSMNTWENAQFSARLLHKYGAQRVVLVSSAMHLRRAMLYFEHFGIRPIPVRGDWVGARVNWWPSSWNFAVTDMALHEYVGVLRYHVYNALGWNIRATQPGSP